MHLKITSLDWIVYEWEIDKLTVESKVWQLTILPHHDNLLTVLSPGLLKFEEHTHVHQDTHVGDFLFKDNMVILSIGGGFCKVENNNIQIITDYSVTWNTDPLHILEQNKKELKQKLEELRSSWSYHEQDLDSLSIELEKIEGQIRLEVFKDL